MQQQQKRQRRTSGAVDYVELNSLLEAEAAHRSKTPSAAVLKVRVAWYVHVQLNLPYYVHVQLNLSY